MATIKRPPRKRIIRPSLREKRAPFILPSIEVSGQQFGSKALKDTPSPMPHEELSCRKVKSKQAAADFMSYYTGEHGPIVSEGTPQLAEDNHIQGSVPYRFSFRKSEEQLEIPDSSWHTGVVFADRESMYSRERSMVLATPFQGTRPQNDFEKEKLSELQIIVGDNTIQDKSVKRRLLRKPLPFSHYKKSQKVRIIHPIDYGYESSQDSLKLSLMGQQSSDRVKHGEPSEEEEMKRQSKKLVKTWLKQIDRKIEAKESNGDHHYLSDDEAFCDTIIDKSSVDKSLQEKQAKRAHLTRRSGKALPFINSMSPQSKMSAQYLEQVGPPDADDDNVDKKEIMDDYRDSPLNLPDIAGSKPHRDNNRGDSPMEDTLKDPKDTQEHLFDSEHLPSILLPGTYDDTEELEHERLKLIHLDRHAGDTKNPFPQSIQSEPVYPSYAMNTFYSKGTSSRTIAHKNKSLRDMAAAFKSKMGYPVASPTHIGDRMWKDRISNYSSTVIHHETYDSFARQKFPKPKPLTGQPSTDSNSSDNKPRAATFSNSHGIFRKPLSDLNHSARSLSEESVRSKRNRSGNRSEEQLTKIKLKTREFSNASLNSLGSSLKSDRTSGVFKGRKFSNGSHDPDITRPKRLYRSDSNLSLNSVRGGSKKGSSKMKRRASKQRTPIAATNE